MRDPETERLLEDVRSAVTAARAGGVSAKACLFDAAVAAVDGDTRSWPSPEARATAVAACRALEPTEARAEVSADSRRPSLLQRLRARACRMV